MLATLKGVTDSVVPPVPGRHCWPGSQEPRSMTNVITVQRGRLKQLLLNYAQELHQL